MVIVPMKNNKLIQKKYHLKRGIPLGLQVDVEKGQNVKQDTVLASGRTSEVIEKVDLANALKVKPGEAKKCLECLNGERVKKGDVLARRKRKVMGNVLCINAMHDGVVNLSEIDAGFLKIHSVAKESTINAGVNGQIVSVVRDKQVDILTSVFKIKPFRISGNDVQGEMFFLSEKKRKIGPNLSDGIMALNFGTEARYLRELALAGVKGIIVGGVDSRLVEDIASEGLFGMTVCIIEGFGDVGIDGELISALKSNDGKLCLIDKRHNELVLTMDANKGKTSSNGEKQSVGDLKVGERVQILDSSNWGEYGEVVDISSDIVRVKIIMRNLEKVVEVDINNLLISR